MKWTVMTAGGLKEHLEDIPGDDWRMGQPIVASALIEWTSRGGFVERGVVMCVGGNLSQTWQSGDVIVFWYNGDCTLLVGGEIKPDTELRVAFWTTDDGPVYNLLDRRVL
jgi:hypothetical protein